MIVKSDPNLWIVNGDAFLTCPEHRGFLGLHFLISFANWPVSIKSTMTWFMNFEYGNFFDIAIEVIENGFDHTSLNYF